jgi:hypothetical protein
LAAGPTERAHPPQIIEGLHKEKKTRCARGEEEKRTTEYTEKEEEEKGGGAAHGEKGKKRQD